MIRILRSGTDDIRAILRERLRAEASSPEAVVREILRDVRERGDTAILESARRFDAPDLANVRVEEAAIRQAPKHEALQTAANRIRAFHDEQARRLLDARQWSLHGVGQRLVPLGRVGIYVPGGLATYPSSVLMNALPARAAGVEDIVMATPARPDGTVAPSILRAARLCGITEILLVGGAAAIAAMAIGTETIAPVDKIVGPGNRYVNEAKRQLWGRVGLDGFAGPSEVCVLADASANPDFAAADLLTQIEHAEDNSAFLIVDSEGVLDAILASIARLLDGSEREATMRTALAAHSLAIVVGSLEEGIATVNAIAPEHVSVMVRNAEGVAEKIVNAGCVLVGDFTPQSAADWVLGPSHTLPTAGGGRFGSPVNVLDFLKVQSVSKIGREELEGLLPVIEGFGQLEGFPMHARGAMIRLEPRS